MSIRALASSLAGLAVAALLLSLLVPQDEDRDAQVPTSAAPQITEPWVGTVAAVPGRLAKVPARVAARRDLRVLSNGCSYSARGIPSCGVLLGAAFGSNSDPLPWERSMGQQLGVRRTYYGPDEVSLAVRTARRDLHRGRVPWISFKAPHSWGSMAAGRGDAWARRLAVRLATLDGPVWVAFHHEPEGDGDIRQWTAMQQRLAPIVRRNAPNVAYSVILTGWHQFYGQKQYSLDSLWPRRTKVDLVGFDVYNQYGVQRDGRTTTTRTPFRQRYFARFEKFAKQHRLAWALAETGQSDLSAKVEPRFVQHLYRGVRRHGGVAVTYFNTTLNSIAPWRLDEPKARQFARVLRQTPTL